MNPESPYLIFGTSLPCFEMCAEEQLADFFTDSMAGTGRPLAGVRILASIRDFDVLADAADPADPASTASTAAQNAKVINALKPRLHFVGSAYQRLQGLDQCEIEIILTVNLKHHSRALYSAIVNHIRAILSMAAIDDFSESFNAWSTEIGETGHKFFLQGMVPAPAAGQNGFAGTSVVCGMRYICTGGFIPV
jgi:hypothetical protein